MSDTALPGDGPDECVVCGGDASHTVGRHCSCNCARVTLRRRDAGEPDDQSALARFADV